MLLAQIEIETARINVHRDLVKHETVTVSAPIENFNQCNFFCSIGYQRLTNAIFPIKIDNIELQFKSIV